MANISIKKENTAVGTCEKQHSDYLWFLDNCSDLHKQHGDCFLAIKNKTVIGVYSTYAEAVRKTKTREKLGTFIVQECTSSPDCYTARVASVGLTVI